MKESFPLVSIVVVSYNAESTIIETLDSIISQTYKNIEIIISDDCSTDKTITVVGEWLCQHEKELSCPVKLLKSEINQGVCRNFNKAIMASSGDYIKIIAGDDILLSNCCADYVEFVKENPSAKFVSSFVRVYDGNFDEINCRNYKSQPSVPSIFFKSTDIQLKKMAFSIFISAPSMFFSRELFEKVGGFDVRYSYEDHPFYINILEAGERIYFCPKQTVGYRVHQSTYNSNQTLFNYQFAQSSRQFRKERCFKYYGLRQKIAVKLYYGLLTILENFHMNKKTKLMSGLYQTVTRIIWALGK